MPLPKELLKKYYNRYFVETGSFVGDSIQVALDLGFQHIKSIECHEPLAMQCRDRFKDKENVQIVNGDSASDLIRIIAEIDEPITFWLDAHFSGEGTSFSGKYCPLLEELTQIAFHHVKTHTILIDDRRLFGREDRKFGIPFPEITEETIIAFLRKINPEYRIFYGDGGVKDDVIIATVKTPPPVKIPDYFLNRYTMGGKVEIRHHYVDQSDASDSHHTEEKIAEWIPLAQRKGYPYYPNANTFLYQALEKYPIRNQSVFIFGSDKPWFETVCKVNGAKSVDVLEYRKIHLQLDWLKYWTFGQKLPVCDCALSISTFEHDGLGRYGDPIDPDGDLKAMRNALSTVKKGGLMYLSVPIGVDTVVWNAHRIYGKHRFPELIKGWELVDSFGIGDMNRDGKWLNRDQYVYQPVFVLRK